ncbi:Biotin--protein ligase [hydrothermal vent metagenome]|uniref:Biotin--protein ligase n=1 Tax=hydrothermal vent metagenome TaxID=652676 RepID=A0A3B0TDD1_9ZZZZ
MILGLPMHILKLNAIDSTNMYLKELMLSKTLDDFTVVVTDKQLKGKGQMGAKWQSEMGKNLTFSILKKIKNIAVDNQFLLNICVSMAVFNSLKNMSVPNLSVKWPNDILSGSSKICGILIENVLLGNQIQESVIGIGLNVNQLSFNNLTNVSSLKLLLGKTFALDELLHDIIKNLEMVFLSIENKNDSFLWRAYENVLFRKDKPSTFKDGKGKFFMGFIRRVSPQGRLVVELEGAVMKEFDLKEIKLLY